MWTWDPSLDGPQSDRAEAGGIGDVTGAEPRLRLELVEGGRLRTVSAQGAHDLDGAPELGDGAERAVEHPCELPIGLADAHLEQRFLDRLTDGGVAMDDPRHLEAVHLDPHDEIGRAHV